MFILWEGRLSEYIWSFSHGTDDFYIIQKNITQNQKFIKNLIAFQRKVFE